jgi:hypothetical protein
MPQARKAGPARGHTNHSSASFPNYPGGVQYIRHMKRSARSAAFTILATAGIELAHAPIATPAYTQVAALARHGGCLPCLIHHRRRSDLRPNSSLKAIMGVRAAVAIALAPLWIPPAQAHADDPCVSITDPAHQACSDEFLRGFYRREKAECEASPNHGQVGQVCG